MARSHLAGVALLLALTACEDPSRTAAPAASTAPKASSAAAAPTASPPPARATTPPARRTPPPPKRPAARPSPTRARVVPTRTPPKAVAAPTCGAPANPWGYHFCGNGSFVTRAPAAFCTYFDCIDSFWDNTKGYVMQCADRTFSHSGGRRGSCSWHGGNHRPLHR